MTALDLILPRRCAVCGENLLRNEDVLCTDCAQRMPLTYFWQREHNPMADTLNAKIQEHFNRENADGTRREPYAFAVALYFYKEGYKNLSRLLKYDAMVHTGRYVAGALGRKILSCAYFNDVDVIVPVPLHWTRLLSRGYNQAGVIAGAVASVLNLSGGGRSVSVMAEMLRRRKRTKTQVHLAMRDKAPNVAGAFEARISDVPEPPVHILLVDDVFTSGSTLAECHNALRTALVDRFGPTGGSGVKISAATLAFVGD